MLQHYVTEHAHTQDLASYIAATTAPAVNNMVAFNDGAGKAVHAIPSTWFSMVNQTGVLGLMGYYCACAVQPVLGYTDMVSVCSLAVDMSGLPPDACVMAFHTSLDLASGPSIPLNSPTLTWFPLEYDSMVLDHTATPPRKHVTVRTSIPVENDQTNARYWGVAIFGSFAASPRFLLGAISLRQVVAENSVFMPNK